MKEILKFFIPKKYKKDISKIMGIIRGEYFIIPKNKITYSHDLLYTYHNADFMKEKLFIESYNLGKATDEDMLIKNYDIEWRVHVLCWASSQVAHLDGDFVDCGVHTGITARAIINYIDFPNTHKKYYLLDTFTGLDKKYSTDKELERNKSRGYEKRGDIYEKVKETFKKFNVEIIKGAVPETLTRVKTDRVCFLSIDMNCVKPEVDALNYFWDKIVTGGMIILDDYGYANSTNDQKAAHDEFAKSKGVKILSLPTCQGLIIKP